jgi:hypothetical protein
MYPWNPGITFLSCHGNPEIGTSEYYKKLEKTQIRKQQKSDLKLAKSEQGRRLIRCCQAQMMKKRKELQQTLNGY